jgi:hypothetical protein
MAEVDGGADGMLRILFSNFGIFTSDSGSRRLVYTFFKRPSGLTKIYYYCVGTDHIESSVAATTRFKRNNCNLLQEIFTALQRLNNKLSMEVVQYNAITE